MPSIAPAPCYARRKDDGARPVIREYVEFLKSKMALSEAAGFEPAQDIHPLFKPHQIDVVRWALRGGRRAIFAAFGLGKTFMQLEIMRHIAMHEHGRQLIIMPLGVRLEFIRDAEKLDMEVRFVRRHEEVNGDGIYITNYESVRDGRLDVNLFNAVSLDEASVLRGYGTKTFQTFLSLFSGVKYRFVATATPSPNRYKELIHYAGFLGIMDTGQALTRFFKRDSTKANNLTLYPHMEHEFWLWMASWAIFLQKPSDLGYSDDGYILPELKVIYHEVKAHREAIIEDDGQVRMFADAAMSLKDASREKRESIAERVDEVKRIIDRGNTDDHWIIWHDQEAERHAIKKAIPEAIEVYGSQDLDIREQRIADFSDGKFRILATKPVLSGSGCNFQRHCHKAIFMGIGFKFNDFIQAIHRIHRFLQERPCEIHIIHTDAEHQVLKVLERKWKQHKEMVEKMSKIIRKYGLSHQEMAKELERSLGVERVEAVGGHYRAVNNDCVDECRRMDENSVDLIITSIPFANHYEYTPSYNDFGFTENNDHFWSQMDYLSPELLRILRPGRVYACHVKDRINFGNVTGYGMPTSSPFHAEAIFHYMRHGFVYMGMITVVTDVVRENNQTYRLGWTEQCKDGTKMGVGSPEYVLLFRKLPTDTSRAYADHPVTKSKEDYSRARWQVDAHAFWRSSGDRMMTAEEMAELKPDVLCKLFAKESLKHIYDYEHHVKIGERLDAKGKLSSTFMTLAPASHHPNVWTDVNRMRTLNGEQTRRGLNNHICPLQFDIVDRLIERYSNPGETVFDPFGGLMTVPYRAILKSRHGMGVELNADYWRDGVKYLEMAERKIEAPTLFSSIGIEQEALA